MSNPQKHPLRSSPPSSPTASRALQRETLTTNNPGVRLHDTEPLYVLSHGDGYSCLGFKNAREHVRQIAALLSRPELALRDEEFGTLAGYYKYRQAIEAWSRSPLARTTYFDPGTVPEVARVLERCRQNLDRVRLVLGDTDTGQPWFEEYDVVGTIHRSGGSLKVPLLIRDGHDGGAAILTACLLCIVSWKKGKVLYRHPLYKQPDLEVTHRPQDDHELPWLVTHQNQPLARFSVQGKAAAYLAFMLGECVEPSVFQ